MHICNFKHHLIILLLILNINPANDKCLCFLEKVKQEIKANNNNKKNPKIIFSPGYT